MKLLSPVPEIELYLKPQQESRGRRHYICQFLMVCVELQLACARIGAVHSVVFAGFSAEALSGRILDSKPSVVLTASAVKRGAKPINLKVNIPSALQLQNDTAPPCG